jgi:hypothetical protein
MTSVAETYTRSAGFGLTRKLDTQTPIPKDPETRRLGIRIQEYS